MPEQVSKRLEKVIGRLEDKELVMRLGLYSSLDLKSILEVLRGDSREVLMNYHRENMREAMKHAAQLARELDGDVIVTADHGEAFGEQGVWEHHAEEHIPPLIEVPWLEVEGTKE